MVTVSHGGTDSIQSTAGHVAMLEERYRSVGDRTWNETDFVETHLLGSRALFTDESLAARKARPRELEVYALLSGLPFPEPFTTALTDVQQRITAVLGDCLHYWVLPQNLGVEYCVFKWPGEALPEDGLHVARAGLAQIRAEPFGFAIGGIQVNPDGCVVARGFDDRGALFDIRRSVRDRVPFLPERQSQWAHVPLGRILEPVGPARFQRLKELVASLASVPIARTSIDHMKLIHETRWYMEERETIEEFSLGGRA